MRFYELNRLKEPDGPYVHWLEEGKILWQAVVEKEGMFSIEKEERDAGLPLTCQPVGGPAFSFQLRPGHAPPPWQYPMPQKLLCLSDIEGNFEALRAILKGNGVIAGDYSWTFGENQLLLLGDLMDRERDVLPVLWLLYKLEGEAEKAGGKVHVLLGNHELMNLLGDLRYLHPKYKALAMQLSDSPAVWEQTYRMLFSDQAELRRWLGSKNTIERIGGILFCHAGFSPAMQQYGPEEINRAIRVLMQEDDQLKAYQSPFYGRQGPLWYRGYGRFGFTDPVSETQKVKELEEVLNHFSAERMVIGHNLVPEIRSDYAGRLISIDVHQEEGSYQALLIEEGICFRIDEQGRKTSLG